LRNHFASIFARACEVTLTSMVVQPLQQLKGTPCSLAD
jgi:hypothetical protein